MENMRRIFVEKLAEEVPAGTIMSGIGIVIRECH